MSDLTVKEISERLAGQALAVATMLLPGGRQHGQEWLCGDINGGPGDSLKVTIHSTYAGQWRDWSNDTDHGDLLDLWRAVKGITAAQAIKEAKAWLGIVDPVRQQAEKHYAKPPAVKTAPMTAGGKAITYLINHRHLRHEIVERLKIEGCAEKQAIVFPSYSPAGELVNRSYRTLDAKKKVWQDTDCAPSLFGWQALPEQAYRDRRVLLCEGQIDCASWLQWGIPALSVPNGSGCTWIDYEWDNLAPFDTFLLAFDADAAGQKIADAVMARLGKHRCLLVSLPLKDANACLQAGFTDEDARDWTTHAKVPKINKLVTAAEMEKRLVAEIQPKEEAFTLPFFKGHWPHSGFYFRPGEVTIWAGFTFAGKSTILNYFQSVALSNKIKIFVASYESKCEVQLRRLATIYMGESLDDDNAAAFVRQMGHHLIMADVVGSQSQDQLLEMMMFGFRRYGTTHFIIDSLMRIKDLEEDFPAQGAFTNRLQEFAKDTGAHVHLVCHLRKPTGTEKPSMYLVKGSSLLVNNVDNVLLVTRNPEKERLRKACKLTPEQEKTMHDTEVIIEKQRETGWIHTYRLKFNPHRYTFQNLVTAPSI